MPRISRRRFLNRSLGALAAAGAGGSVAQAAGLHLPRAMSSSILGANERFRMGAVGTGQHGRHDIRTFLRVEGMDIDIPVICDVDDAQLAKCVQTLTQAGRPAPETVKDFRRVCDRQDIDVLLVATPDHWHPLVTITAMQAGKDVYCEKPLANSIGESRRMVDWAAKTRRVVQMGTQWRMSKHHGEAVEFVQSGQLGKVRMVRCWAALAWFTSIGKAEDQPPPPGLDWEMWLGPAPYRPYNPNRVHFKFRWFWDYAGGLMTDWGVHLLNIALWAMNAGFPRKVSSSGGKYAYDDMAETPDTQVAVFDYGDFVLIWEHMAGIGHGPNGKEHGVAFYGNDATLTVDTKGWEVVPEESKKDKVPALRKNIEEDGEMCRINLMKNFLECVRTREKPAEHIELGHFVTSVAHLGNLALRTGRTIEYDAENMKVIGNEQANALIMPAYRAPWKLPEV